MNAGRVSFTLIENALDYLLSAAQHVREGDPRSLKYALRDLTSAIELLLKARLYRENWKFIFRDLTKASKSALRRGEFKSVDFDGAVDRLEDEAGVTIDSKVLSHLRTLRALRHQVEHFAVDVQGVQVISLLTKGYHFVIDFCRTELPEEIVEQAKLFGAIIENLQEFEAFVQERRKLIGPELASAAGIWGCPRCGESALMLGGERPQCAFCGFETGAEELAESEGSYGVEQCPECKVEACILVVYNNDEAGWVCMACATWTDDYGRCSRCGRLAERGDDPCPECWRELMEKD